METKPETVRILIIDDDHTMRLSLATYLEDSGYETLEAENGLKGLELFREKSPDLVLMDIRMPVMDGLTALPFLVGEKPETPVIIISGMGTLDDSIKALRAGAWDYITKPIHDLAFLEHAVNRALERAQLLRENRKHHEHLEREVQRRTQELEEKNRMLVNSRRLFRSVADSAMDAIIAINSVGEIIIWNDGATEIFGYDRNEIMGKPSTMIVPEQLRGGHEKALVKVSKSGLIRRQKGPRELIGLHKDGTEFPVEISLGSWFAEGEVFFSAVIRDITERKIAIRDLLQAQKMDALGKLAGGIAHDFNNMLLPIMTLTSMMLKAGAEDSRDHLKLEKILEASERARDLVARILTFSHQEEPAAQKLDIAKIVNEALQLLSSTLHKSIILESEIDETTGQVMADASQIETVILNLVSNAVDSFDNLTGNIRLSLERQDLSDKTRVPALGIKAGIYAVLVLSDSGCGMSNNTLEHLFEPFFTTKGVGGGTGLGLAMVHSIVSSHNGVINVSSIEGEGSTFTIYLPLV